MAGGAVKYFNPGLVKGVAITNQHIRSNQGYLDAVAEVFFLIFGHIWTKTGYEAVIAGQYAMFALYSKGFAVCDVGYRYRAVRSVVYVDCGTVESQANPVIWQIQFVVVEAGRDHVFNRVAGSDSGNQSAHHLPG